METDFVVKAIIQHPKLNKYLLLIRSLSNTNRPGDFDIPGGSVENGELLEDALYREIKEETKLSIKIISPIFINSNYNKKNNKYYIFVGYFVRAETSDVTINKKEHESFCWVSLNKLKSKHSEHILIQDTIKTFLKFNNLYNLKIMPSFK